ncbi:phage tail tape measure protein [Arthrobacter agilis]|uniref:phage tail tape measure protein n=1 Tax=Arthrobacter agilis TaxID=37921 RepID=UPI002366DFD9|nr:phage tail tape measure protein [Arthrobacter agilis]WDF32254.1 phage tail tape measure protein [Arthrobacter agilis]
MADRSITLRLTANVQGLVAGFRTGQQAAKDFGSQTQRFAQDNRQSLEQLGQAGMAVGGTLAAGFGLAVTKFASFDKAMSSVRAATHETEGNMDLLREAAVRAGADTAFSAEEAARGIEEMAKAGVSTADIMGGGLDGALALAAAGALDVGDAAELAATAMTQFGLSGEEIPHIADLLAAGAGKAQGSVEDMGMALKQAGLVADQTGLTIEETTGGLAAFAAAGLVGSDAGTSFKSMLQRLTPQSKEAQEKMAELGISAYDAQGNFIGLSEFAGNLKQSMADLTVEERNAAMATIFGSDAVRAASVLYENGAEGVQKWEDAVNDAGYAAETAALMQDNLAGDLEKLGGAFDTVFLQAGSGANDSLRSLVQTLEDVVDRVGEIPGPVLSAVGIVAGLTGGALLLGGAFLTVVPRIADTVTAISDLRAKAPGATTAIGRLGRAAGVAAVAMVALQVGAAINDSLGEATKSAEEMAQAILRVTREGEAFSDVFTSDLFASSNGFAMRDEITGMGDALAEVNSIDFGETVNDWYHGLTGWKSQINETRETIANMDTALTDFASSGDLEGAAEGFRQIAADAKESGVSLEDTAAQFPQYLDHLRSLATEAGVALDEQELLNWAMGEVPPAMEAAASSTEGSAAALEAQGAAAEQAAELNEAMLDRLKELGLAADGTIVNIQAYTEALFASGLAVMSSRDASFQWEDSLRGMNDAILEVLNTQGELGAVLDGTATDFNTMTDSGLAANDVFQGLVEQGLSVASTFSGDTTKSIQDVQAQLLSTYDAGVQSAMGFGMSEEAAIALTREVLQIPEGVTIESWMSEEAKNMAAETTGAAKAVPANVRIESSMSEAAKLTADATKQSADDVPEQETIDSWMSDAAFIEAVRTRAAALGIPEKEAIDSFMSSAARNEADNTTARILGIPPGVSVTSFMSNYARIEAQNTAAAINAIPSYKESRIVVVTERNERVGVGQVGLRATGGRLPAHAAGYRLPSTGPGTDVTDGILGISAKTGAPMSWLDGGEWVINNKSSEKYHRLLGAINRDDAWLSRLPALADGGRAHRSAPVGGGSMVLGSSAQEPVSATVDAAVIGAAVSEALSSWQPMVQIAGRTLLGIMKNMRRT